MLSHRILVAVVALAAGCYPALPQGPVRINLGEGSPALHIPVGREWVEVVPALEDYYFMLFDVCDALEITDDECLIYPMNGDLGGNAVATVEDGNKVIVYDRTLSSIIGSGGAEMVIAHEVAHHLCGHLGTPVDPAQELEADAFAGAAMKRMGRSLEDALAAAEVFSTRPSRSHPGRAERVAAIKRGWFDPQAGKSCVGRKP